MYRKIFRSKFKRNSSDDVRIIQTSTSPIRVSPPVPYNVMRKASAISAAIASGKHWSELDGYLAKSKKCVLFRLPSFYRLIGKLDEKGDIYQLLLGRKDAEGQIRRTETTVPFKKQTRVN